MPVGAIWVFSVPFAMPGCRERGHFSGETTMGPQHGQLPLLLSAAAPLATRLYRRQAFPNV